MLLKLVNLKDINWFNYLRGEWGSQNLHLLSYNFAIWDVLCEPTAH